MTTIKLEYEVRNWLADKHVAVDPRVFELLTEAVEHFVQKALTEYEDDHALTELIQRRLS